MSGATPPASDEPPHQLRNRSLIIVLVVQLLIGAALLTWVALGRPVPGLEKVKPDAPTLAPIPTADRFDGARAYALLERQVQEYGVRPAGSANSRRLADALVELVPGGHFQAVPGGLRNIVGMLPGTGAPIVLGAHYDTAAIKDFVGANDGAGGVAALVEIARSLREAPRPANVPPIRFVLFDGEELPPGGSEAQFEQQGLRGSRVAAAIAPKPQAMILLDYIAEARGLRIPRERNSDPALWAKLRAAAAQVGTSAIFPRADSAAITDDHVPYLQANVPSIDLIDFEFPQTHTPQDDLAHVSERSLDAVGETVLQLLGSW